MKELEKQISDNIEKIEEMIKNEQDKNTIEEQRKILDELLLQFLMQPKTNR